MRMFICVKNGRATDHNLTEVEVYEMRLSEDASSISFVEQECAHGHNGMAQFCPECAEHIEGLRDDGVLFDIRLMEAGIY